MHWYRAADLVVVPSYSESFGLVALEAQACATPVVAADVGGLRDAVADGRSGLLVPGHEATVWAARWRDLLRDDRGAGPRSARGAVQHAAELQLGPHRRRAARACYAAAVADVRRAAGGGGSVGAVSDARAASSSCCWTHLARRGHRLERGGRPGEVVATLPGEHKLRTTVSLLVGDHALSASRLRDPAPGRERRGVHRWLLRRNTRLSGVAYAIDDAGDVYLVGRLPLVRVDDRTPGRACSARCWRPRTPRSTRCWRSGFLSSMRREWAWRVSRGESTRNLEAFRHLLEARARRR